jgi:transposase-like protein
MKGEGKKRLTAQRKLELYLETRQKDANLGEILRRYGVHLNDLRRIEAVVKRAALEALTVRCNGHGPAAAGTGDQ